MEIKTVNDLSINDIVILRGGEIREVKCFCETLMLVGDLRYILLEYYDGFNHLYNPLLDIICVKRPDDAFHLTREGREYAPIIYERAYERDLDNNVFRRNEVVEVSDDGKHWDLAKYAFYDGEHNVWSYSDDGTTAIFRYIRRAIDHDCDIK